MQDKEIVVFDLDGTLLSVNSFREVSERLLRLLLRQKQWDSFLKIVKGYFLRRLGRWPHLQLKQLVSMAFEQCLPESSKQELVDSVIQSYWNEKVGAVLKQTPNAMVVSASPYSIVSRIQYLREIPSICSLDPRRSYPSQENQGPGKVENLRFYFGQMPFRVMAFYTDSREEDAALIDISEKVYLCSRQGIQVIKSSHDQARQNGSWVSDSKG